MAKKLYVDVTVRLVLRTDEAANLEEVMADMDYSFSSKHPDADVEDTRIEHYEIKDAK